MQITTRIDYRKIAEAGEYYKEKGFVEVEVPWIVQKDSYYATKPFEARDFYTLDGYLNASGEQSFIELLLQGIPLTKNFCITPCFRDESFIDEIHFKYFFKLELINTSVSKENLHLMIEEAKEFYERYVKIKVVSTDGHGEAFDIVDEKCNIELGSYGVRRYKHLSWIYGTGIALPRLDIVINKQ